MAAPVGKGPEQPQMPDRLSKVPKDVLKMIMPNLEEGDLINLAPASKLFHSIIKDNKAWIQVAKEYNVKLKNPKNAQREMLGLIHEVNQVAVDALEKARFGVNRKEIFNDREDPFDLTLALNKRIVKNKEATEYISRINGLIKSFGDFSQFKPKSKVPLFVHLELLNYMELHPEKLNFGIDDIIRMISCDRLCTHLGSRILLHRAPKDSDLEWVDFFQRVRSKETFNIVLSAFKQLPKTRQQSIVNGFFSRIVPLGESYWVAPLLFEYLPPDRTTLEYEMHKHLPNLSFSEKTTLFEKKPSECAVEVIERVIKRAKEKKLNDQEAEYRRMIEVEQMQKYNLQYEEIQKKIEALKKLGLEELKQGRDKEKFYVIYDDYLIRNNKHVELIELLKLVPPDEEYTRKALKQSLDKSLEGSRALIFITTSSLTNARLLEIIAEMEKAGESSGDFESLRFFVSRRKEPSS